MGHVTRENITSLKSLTVKNSGKYLEVRCMENLAQLVFVQVSYICKDSQMKVCSVLNLYRKTPGYSHLNVMVVMRNNFCATVVVSTRNRLPTVYSAMIQSAVPKVRTVCRHFLVLEILNEKLSCICLTKCRTFKESVTHNVYSIRFT
jgi:hypothetical protein